MRDIADAKTFGVISKNIESGITEIARPIGVIGAVVPSTNPAVTPANNIINALKCCNAIVLSPSPKGVPACVELLDYIHADFDKVGEDKALVQMVPGKGSKEKTQPPRPLTMRPFARLGMRLSSWMPSMMRLLPHLRKRAVRGLKMKLELFQNFGRMAI